MSSEFFFDMDPFDKLRTGWRGFGGFWLCVEGGCVDLVG